jgi:allophanate hydrolase
MAGTLLACTCLYTSTCTKLDASALITVADWQTAYRDGVDPAALLAARRDRLAARAEPLYLHVADNAALAGQLARLAAQAAAHADRAALLAAHPLWGVPFVVKDNIDIAGVPTSAACPAFAYRPSRDATVVRRLLDAGAIWLAKANLDQFATGLVGTRSPHGAPASAWSSRHVSGGSSSGSAVAVARGDVPFALGTDTAGSGRVPAGFNHVVGLKPTPGRVGTAGVLPACRSLDCPSVFALTVDDAALVLALIEGEDADDDYSRFRPGPASWAGGPAASARPGHPGTLRVAVPAALPPEVDAEVAAAFEGATATLRTLGHAVVPVDMALLYETAELLYGGPWVAERHLVLRELLARDPSAVDPAVRAVVTQAARFDADDVFAAQYRLRALARRAEALWRQADLLMVPTAPRHPIFDAVAADPLGANAALGLFTNFVNLLGWCALALPASVSASGLPQGVSFVAPANHDAALAGFGRAWQAAVAQPLGATGRKAAQTRAPVGPVPATRPVLPLAVVGAHLSGLPLNHQLTDLGATRIEATRTAPAYRLYALPGTTPRKPGLLRVADGGVAVEVELWALPMENVGSFLAGIPAPLGLGTLALADGRAVHGFLCEPAALAGAEDVSRFGGWRAYLASL